MKAFDLIKKVLEAHPATRNDDKALMFTVWDMQGKVKNRSISYEDFKTAMSPETIRRARQAVQERFSLLRPTDPLVLRKRGFRRKLKGGFIYSEEIK